LKKSHKSSIIEVKASGANADNFSIQLLLMLNISSLSSRKVNNYMNEYVNK